MPSFIIHAKYLPESPTNPPAMTSYITRYEFIHAGQRNNGLTFVREDAAALLSAITSWKHDTDFFSSMRGYKMLDDFRTSWSNLLMAGKKTPITNDKRPEWKGFLEATLDDDQIAAADAWKPKAAELFEFVHALLEDGYDLSLSYQSNSKSYTVTLKDIKPGRPTAGYAVSTRDATAADCLKLALYKHFNVLIRDWSPLLGNTVRPRRG